MHIQTFQNKKGLIYGTDPKRIDCKCEGILRIGRTEIAVGSEPTLMPMLFYGCTGDYEAAFQARDGTVYDLGKVAVRGGWIQPPPPAATELMELRCRLEQAEERIEFLSGIFDTNALNFLI